MEKSHLNQRQYHHQTVLDDYNQWKKRAPFLYDTLQLSRLTSHTNTFQWTNHKQPTEDGTEVTHQVIIGTSSIQNKSLMLLRVTLPKLQKHIDFTEYSIDAPKQSPHSFKRVEVEAVISQNSDVLRARCHPQKSSLVASKCSGVDPQLSIYDFSDVTSENVEPVVRLQGHTAEGFGLDWNKQKHNYIASGSMDGKICIWDVAGSKETDSSLNPSLEYTFHSGGVEDVNWNKVNPNILGSSGQDKLIAIWDIRDRKKITPQFQKVGHTGHVYTIDFSPYSETLLLSGGDDSQIGLWDLRNIAKRIQTFTGHDGSIGKVQWSPHNRHLFSSASNDRRVVLWDSSRSGEIDEYGEPAQMVFIHAGHQSPVIDCDWFSESYLMGSVDDSGRVDIWRFTESIAQKLQQNLL